MRAERAGAAIRNNAGVITNHSCSGASWAKVLPSIPNQSRKPSSPTSVDSTASRKMLNKEASSRFGSGWAWLYLTPDKNWRYAHLPIRTTPSWMLALTEAFQFLVSMWEHAYYLKYQNKEATTFLPSGTWSTGIRSMKTTSMHWTMIFLRVIEKDAWTELKEFHKVMAATFHPAEEGDFKPIRERSGEMALKAMAIQKGRIPTSFNTPEINKAVADLGPAPKNWTWQWKE